MATNWPGIAATLAALVRPHILEPALRVPSIASLDLTRLRNEAQVTGIVIDKDNCIARPRSDTLADDPLLHQAWRDLVDTFGPDNVLVVSNSAGDHRKDPLTIQAQALSRNLGVPVLVHPHPKPAHACVHQVAAHFLSSRDSLRRLPSLDDAAQESTAQVGQVVFSPLARARLASTSSTSSSSLLPPRPTDAPDQHRRKRTRILVIGDRLATDMVLAHRLSNLSLTLALPSSSSASPSSILGFLRRRAERRSLGAPGDVIEAVPVLTTHLWAREGAGTTLVRWVERAALWGLGGRGARRRAAARRARGAAEEEEVDWTTFVKGYAAPTLAPARTGLPEGLDSPGPAAPAAVRLPSPSLPSLATLSALPSRLQATLLALPSRLARLPSLALLHLQRLPAHLLLLTRRTAHRALAALEVRLPAWLARLGAPDGLLARLVGIYARPGSLAPSPTGALRPIGRGEVVDPARDTVRRAGGALERLVDRVGDGVEGVWGEARRRVERGASVGKSAASGVEQIKGWVLRRRERAAVTAGTVKEEKPVQ
ncbi:hypothetical protein JCM9279_001773 [Rhodotorula babjevae]